VPDLQTMPGVRTREHATAQHEFTPSRKLGDATEVGRWEMQTPAYRGQVTRLQRRPAPLAGGLPDDWTHADKRLRAEVIGSDGLARWLYANQIDNVGGLGPARYAAVKATLGDGLGTASSEAEFAKLRASGRLLGGSDPDLSSYLRDGEQVLVLGGSPTGAWAGQDAARRGARATIVGEDLPGAKPVAAQAELMRLLRQGDASQIEAFLEARVAQTHGGSALRRNRQPGTAYAPAEHRPSNLTVELGVPTKMRQLPDGRVEVTLGVGEASARAAVAAEGVAVLGETATVRIYDRVIAAYGQDPGAPGGQAALLGKGAEADVAGNALREVPADTIALRMILESKDGALVGLESLDGSVRLLGAAYASPQLAPWVIAAERASFLAKSGEATLVSHTGARISDDSPKQGGVIELQRDKLPVANEVLMARNYQLHERAGDTLRLPAEQPQRWSQELERFLTLGMHGAEGRIKATLLASGRDGVHTFRVHNGAEEVGLIRVYDSMAAAELDVQVRAMVREAVPTLEPEIGRGAVRVGAGQAELTSHRAEADARHGKTMAALAEQWAAMPEGTEKQRQRKDEAFDNTVGAAVKRTAETLGTLHRAFASGEVMSAAAKEQAISAVHAELAAPEVARVLGGAAEVAKVRAMLAPMEAGFRAAQIPTTAELGDARAAALRFKDYKRDDAATKAAQEEDPSSEVMMFGRLSAEDVAGVAATLDAKTGKGTGAGAADVAEFLASLRAVPELAGRWVAIERRFFDDYARAAGIRRADIARATRWYMFRSALQRLSMGDSADLTRLTSSDVEPAQ
jgi:hypothetical protein